MKKKLTLITYLLLLLILISISRGLLISKKISIIPTIKKETTFKQQIKKLSYYKEENLSRYKTYKNNNSDLTTEQIVTNVNIGLDTDFYTNTKEASNLNTTILLVNKYNYLDKNYVPNNLENINTKYANTNMKLVKEARIAFEEMSEAASLENLNIIAMSTYRSYSYQDTLYNRYVAQDGKELADTYSARPGHSEHQTGLAVDVYNKTTSYTEFENTQEFLWMQENAYKYGFILRYPKDKTYITGYQYESWHYRYVGIEIAAYIQKHNITYDEYYIQHLDK